GGRAVRSGGRGTELAGVRPSRHVALAVNGRVAELTVRAPADRTSLAEGAAFWPLRAFRELDDALLHLRFEHEDVGVVLLRARGNPAHVLAADEILAGSEWLAVETRLLLARVLPPPAPPPPTFSPIPPPDTPLP